MSIGTILLIVLVLLLVGALPAWPYSSGWGYLPQRRIGLGTHRVAGTGGDRAIISASLVPRSFRTPRMFLGLSAAIAMGCMAAAAAGVSNPHACPVSRTPSKLDYLVLASMADAPHMLAFGGYRPTALERAESDTVAGDGRRHIKSLELD